MDGYAICKFDRETAKYHNSKNGRVYSNYPLKTG